MCQVGRLDKCTDKQRAPAVKLSQKLHGGAPSKLTPCDLYPYIQGRTLWLVG